MNGPRHICVFLGGPSAEREVSLRSGAAVARALRALGHRVEELDPVGDWRVPGGTELVFLALHGTYGEDGTVQEILDRLGVPYTGTGAAASRLAFDKVGTKERLMEKGIPTLPFVRVDSVEAPWPEGWEPPVVVKPVCQGSSVGMSFVEDRGEWRRALEAGLAVDARVLVEERVIGREVTVAVLGDEALPVVEIRPRQGAYDYANKYTSGATEYLCPAPFDAPTTRRLQEAGLGAFRAVDGRDYGRVDVMVRADGSPVVLEVNTLPGMTETSLFPKAAAAAGLGFGEVCQRMVDLALGRCRAREARG